MLLTSRLLPKTLDFTLANKIVEKEIVILASAIVSGLIAWIISYMKVRSEIKKLKYDMHVLSAENVLKKRLEVYGEVYQHLEEYAKRVQRRDLPAENARRSFEKIDNWQTTNGYLLSSQTNSIYYSFIRKLRRITEASDEVILNRVEDNEKRTEMIRDAWELELSLQNDLGIFAFEYFECSDVVYEIA